MRVFLVVFFLFNFAFSASLNTIMKKELKPSFQEVSKVMRTGQVTEKTKSAAKQLLISFNQAQHLIPEYIPTHDRQNVKKPEAQDIEDFKTIMRDMILLSQQLIVAVEASNIEEIKKIVPVMDSLRRKAHDRFATE